MSNLEYYQQLENDLREILAEMKTLTAIEPGALQDVSEYIEFAEYGLAFDLLVYLLRDKRLNLSEHNQKLIDSLANRIELSSLSENDSV